jgi:hypothetical protein
VHRGLPIAVLQAWGSLAAQQQAHNVEVPHIGSTVQRRAAARPRGCIWVGTQLQQQLYDVTMPRPGSEDQRREARIACRPSKGWQIQSLQAAVAGPATPAGGDGRVLDLRLLHASFPSCCALKTGTGSPCTHRPSRRRAAPQGSV